MLINLTPNLKESERRKGVANEHNLEHIDQFDERLMQYGTGFYQCNYGFNFSNEEFIESLEVYGIDMSEGKSAYGVADDVDQIKEYFKNEIDDLNRKFIISGTPVYQDKSNKGKGGGWRWHKWGEYIGKLEPQCEYLDDEEFGDEFKYVICFQLHEVNSNNKKS